MSKPNFRARPTIRLAILALIAAVLVLLPTTLRADNVTYDLASTDTLAGDGGSITGSFTVNTSALTVTGTLVADGITFTCTNCVMFSPFGDTTLEGFEPVGPAGDHIVIGWAKVPPFPDPLDFNSSVSYCAGCLATGLDFLSAGDYATVPEPSTALMVISGLAVLPFIRRRRAKA